jgi:hypothetical protein
MNERRALMGRIPFSDEYALDPSLPSFMFTAGLQRKADPSGHERRILARNTLYSDATWRSRKRRVAEESLRGKSRSWMRTTVIIVESIIGKAIRATLGLKLLRVRQAWPYRVNAVSTLLPLIQTQVLGWRSGPVAMNERDSMIAEACR